MDTYEFTEDIYKWNIYTIFKYISVHYIQFILLIIVFIIIYTVDHISNINARLFSIPFSSPLISNSDSKNKILQKSKKIKK